MYQKTTLPNGLRLITAPMLNAKSCAISILVGVGSRYETKQNNGISHVLEHMLFKGSKKYPSKKDLAFTVEQLGGRLNGFTSEDVTGYNVKILPEYFEHAFDVLADMVLNPLLKKEEVEKERGVIIEEINQQEDDPALKVLQVFLGLLWPNSPLGFRVIGTKNNIKTITQKDLADFQKNFYKASDIVISIAGRINKKKVEAATKKYFRNLQTASKNKFDQAETKKGAKCQVFSKQTEQTHLVLGFPALSFFDKDRFALSVLNNLLGRGLSSRLLLNIREEKGLAYTIYSINENFFETGVFVIHAGLNTKKIGEAIKAIFVELEELKKKLIDRNELQKSKNLIKSSLLFSLDDPLRLSEFLGIQELHKGKIETAEEKIREIEKVTVGDVRRLASRIFGRENAKVALIGPYKKYQEKEFEELISSQKH